MRRGVRLRSTLHAPRFRDHHTPRGSNGPSRKEIIESGGWRGKISIADNPDAKETAPWYEASGMQAVTDNDKHIIEKARLYDVDPDLVRAIVWIESTHGYYDYLPSLFDRNDSVRPMNINTKYWGDTWGNREWLKTSANNIEAGTRMLKSISTAMPGSSIAAQATIYNHANASKVSDFGMRVQKIYREKPWVDWNDEPKTPWFIPPRPKR